MTNTRDLSPVGVEPAVTRPRTADPTFQAFVIRRSVWRLAAVHDTSPLPWRRG